MIKREDPTGFGFGGNKLRRLEYCIAEALAQKADLIGCDDEVRRVLQVLSRRTKNNSVRRSGSPRATEGPS